jgi:hypothetical protein
MYMASAGNTAAAGNAKTIISDSLLGIVAALAAYLIMYVINPDLTKINIGFTAVSTVAPTTALPGGTLSDSAARQKLSTAGIGVNKNNCPTPQDTDCTSLDGIPSVAIDDLIKLKNACVQSDSNCSVMVTGGTEAGHVSHGVGKPMLDVRSTTNQVLGNYLARLKASANLGSFGISQICTTSADAAIRYNCSTDEGADHYHIAFKS